jgi:hypothetical protein
MTTDKKLAILTAGDAPGTYRIFTEGSDKWGEVTPPEGTPTVDVVEAFTAMLENSGYRVLSGFDPAQHDEAERALRAWGIGVVRVPPREATVLYFDASGDLNDPAYLEECRRFLEATCADEPRPVRRRVAALLQDDGFVRRQIVALKKDIESGEYGQSEVDPRIAPAMRRGKFQVVKVPLN